LDAQKAAVATETSPNSPSRASSDATPSSSLKVSSSPSSARGFVNFPRVSLLVGTLKTTSRSAGLSVLMFLLCVGCIFTAALVIICPRWGDSNKRLAAASAPRAPLQGSPMTSDLQAFSRSPPSGVLLPPHPTQLRSSTVSLGAFSDYAVGVTPPGTGLYPPMPPTQLLPAYCKQVPPPLCPTLVMPVCEARFGVPVTDIAKLGVEGEISIVGLSGNPLLRSMIRLDHHQHRTLEICMPEKNSAPRVTVAPSSLGLAPQGYDIRGMKGTFYGFLEIQPCGTCAVIKDGQTVLLLDGDTENLQLSIRSGLGTPLASVSCSAEPFGGVDHVEVRVEPGVDTVLVLAVVLCVLVLAER